MTQEAFASAVLSVRKVRIIGGERALDAETAGSLGAILSRLLHVQEKLNTPMDPGYRAG